MTETATAPKDARGILNTEGREKLLAAIMETEPVETPETETNPPPPDPQAETYAPAISPEQWHDIERRVQITGGTYRENVFAGELKRLLPLVLTTGTAWRVFDGIRWEMIAGPERFLPLAIELLGHFNHDTARRAGELVAHVGASCQTTQNWRGAYAFDKSGAVLLNLENGILRVTRNTFDLLPHDWKQGFTLMIPTPWQPAAECPAFTATLAAAMPDSDDRELFRLFAGSILEPSARLEAGLAVFGPSGTGKSTLVDSGIAEAIGGPASGTVSRVSLRQLCDPKSYSLPGLEFSLVNIITEGDALEVEESGNFKSIISGEPIECREIYGKPRVIQTTAKLLLATNALPRFRNGTDAEGRRLRLLNFDQVPAKPDPELKHRIQSEKPGILRWMAAALQDVMGLRNMPRGGASAKRVTDRFALSNDSLGCFVHQECQLDPASIVIKSELLEAFNEFADSHGFASDNAVWFFRKLLDRFPHLTQSRRNGLRVIVGINLKSGSNAG
jgi:P4 family phage/plasmid primase-like protien